MMKGDEPVGNWEIMLSTHPAEFCNINQSQPSAAIGTSTLSVAIFVFVPGVLISGGFD